MSKLTLEFNIPEEQQEADISVNAQRLHSTLFDFMNHIRSKRKHGTLKEQKAYEEVSKEFYNLVESNQISHLF